jgi:RHS repeat-associated protein
MLTTHWDTDVSDGLSKVLQLTDTNGIVKSRYVYGLGLLERIDSANNALFYHFDAQHNTIALTDANDSTYDNYTYDPFGALLSHTGTTNQPFTFLGEYGVERENTSLYYVRARYYDAANGRFLSKDIYPYDLNEPQTINRYIYATNNPLSIFDYSGLYGDKDNAGLDIFNHSTGVLLTLAETNASRAIPTSLYRNGKLLYYNTGVSFLTKPISTLGKLGGPILSVLSLGISLNDVTRNGNHSLAAKVDLGVNIVLTAATITAAIFASPVIVAVATIGGIAYGVTNIVSYAFNGKSFFENLFPK